MTFIRTIPPEEAMGLLKELYDYDEKQLGFIANYTKALSLHPEILARSGAPFEIPDCRAGGDGCERFPRRWSPCGRGRHHAFYTYDHTARV